jgi:hypothetical protein
LVLTDEGEDDEVITQLELDFSDAEGRPKQIIEISLTDGRLIEVTK